MCLGIPGRIVSVDDAIRRLATVDIGGERRQVNIGCIVDADHPAESCLGEWVVVHLGFAMSRINEAEAAAIFNILAELVEVRGEGEAMRPAGATTAHLLR